MLSTTPASNYSKFILCLIVWVYHYQSGFADDLYKRGANIFYTGSHLSGRLEGTEALGSPELKCANCHEPSRSPFKNDNSTSKGPGGEIRHGILLQTLSRRGGPSFRYDLSSFCQLLKTGVDPTNIVVPRLMPRYDISTDDCRALWIYLGSTI